ncbi:PREDICTED: reticulocalbin-2 [Papilio polytes]|uniref:reticulocalbin-2 n=1 Tax=Papilio polytes TaxID=76194 RepID=UPI0006768247|nr:PREDICTED: reticulocalbin-2 [Papilio polytes]
MAYKCVLFVSLIAPYILHCTTAAVHNHNIDTIERESDGSYRARDYDHYTDAGHNLEFDHEAILGSVKEAEEYDKLSPEESQRRLAKLLPKMDLNGDQFIDRKELKKWILNSFAKLSREEAQERLLEADENHDGLVTWAEYLHDTFGANDDEEVAPDDTGDTGMLVREEKQMWALADKNGDEMLDLVEFEVFSNPEEHEEMQPFLVSQTIRERDHNKDGRIDFKEYLGDRAAAHDKTWLVSEQDKFTHELDLDGDGALAENEVRRWIIPDNEEIAEEEVEHLFASADDDHDELLSFSEVLAHQHVFVGSEATDYGDHLVGDRFDDEL